MTSETKLDSFFPNGQFQIHGYSEPLINLTEMEMVVEYLYLSARIYQQN